jgi:DNA-binding beta-propeller fold protein YncE
MLKQRLRNPRLGWGLLLFLIFLMPARETVTAISKKALAVNPIHQAVASGMAVVVNGGTVGGISLIDPITETAIGPFLQGQLGDPGTLLDCVVTPDGTTAIVSNFSARRVFFIEVGTLPPTLLGSVSLPIPAEDLDLTPDGRFVLVTDGGGVPGFFTPIVLSIDVATRTVVGQSLSFGFFAAQSVAIAPDNRTVVITDADAGFITPLQLTPNGTFGMEGGTGTLSFERPNNVTIAPDGQRAVVCNVGGRSVNILRIDGATNTVSIIATLATLPGGQQGAVFTPDGTKILVLSVLPSPDQLSVLEVQASGLIVDTGQRVNLLSDLNRVLFGVDVIAVTADGTKAYIGNAGTGRVVSGVTVVDLTTAPPVVRGTIPTPMPVSIAFPQTR